MKSFSRIGFALACLLSGLAGFVDGIGFLHLGGLFVSFMSGNSTRLGVDLWRGEWAEAGRLAAIIGLFFVGAILGSLIGRDGMPERRPHVLVAVGVLLLPAALVGGAWPLAAGGLMTLAMGVENAVFQRKGGAGIGLTYMTGAVVRAGQAVAEALRGGPRADWAPHLALWTALGIGACLGAFAYAEWRLAALLVPALLALVLAPVVRSTGRLGLLER